MARKTPAEAAEKPQQAPAPAPAPSENTDQAPVAERPWDPEQENQPAAAPDPAQAPAPTVHEPAAVLDPAPAPASVDDEPIPELEDFIARHEKAAQAVDLVVTAISHPAAKPRHHPGVYSGFPITTGALSATYSDGSKR